jgi:hypothetical protein
MKYPNTAVRARWEREEEARRKLQNMPPEASDLEVIALATEFLLAWFDNKWQLSIILEAAFTPVEYDWKYKNVRGITTTDVDRARAWISTCMRLGYGVFAARTKRGSAFGPGSIAHLRQRASRA